MTDTAFQIEPLDASFGAIVTDIDLAHLSQVDFESLYGLWLNYALLIFPDQHLSHNAQIAFAKRFGALEFDLAPISNVRADGSVRQDDKDDVVKILKGNMGWHHDSTYMPVQAKGAVFTAHTVPSQGGETGWADMTAAYAALSPQMQARIANLSAYHSLYHSQQKMGFKPKEDGSYSGYGFHNQSPPLRPLVKIHPETGKPGLLIGRHAYGIPGMSEAASEALLDELNTFACQPPRVYHHHWQVGDAVLWDNRCLMHQATPWPMHEPRVMYHARIAGDEPSEFAASA
ncbi:MAG: TauD/TfdA dioxygenase family protein [bacterium]